MLQVMKGSLPVPHRRLVELMQDVNFGRIERLMICNREPVLDPRPIVIREHKFSGENGPRPELHADDFVLKAQIVELFSLFDEIEDGVIEVLEIKHGLPFRVFLREAAA